MLLPSAMVYCMNTRHRPNAIPLRATHVTESDARRLSGLPANRRRDVVVMEGIVRVRDLAGGKPGERTGASTLRTRHSLQPFPYWHRVGRRCSDFAGATRSRQKARTYTKTSQPKSTEDA